MSRCEFNIAHASFFRRSRWLEGLDDILLYSLRQGEHDVIPILQAAVDCRCIGTRGRNDPHCEGVRPSPLPKLVGRMQNALLQSRIRSPWHQFSPAGRSSVKGAVESALSLGKVVAAATEVPLDRWDWQQYFNEDPNARDKVYPVLRHTS
jgi:hypothetical protein